MTTIRKVLVANRGEIACRVIRTCKKMGILTVAVFSEADRNALFVRQADEAVFIGPSPATQSYLKVDEIIRACKLVGADAVHPGYGFLSENEGFALRCAKEGITFIGPLPSTIAMMGDKREVKLLLIERSPNVPLIPGYNGKDQSVETLRRESLRVGLPVLLKAVAGGGGKGMRVIRDMKTFDNDLAAVQSEAKNSFGNDSVLIEKYFDSCRHIEIQIFGDNYGHVIALAERDCSTQRRHQKVIEECPSAFVTPALRAAMCECAVSIGEMSQYRGAGTVEFLVDQNRKFYFLEVNTRLQVEHPITEIRFGLDLVQLQIKVAQGSSLTDMQLNQAQVQALDGAGGIAAYTPVAVAKAVKGGKGVLDPVFRGGDPDGNVEGPVGHALQCRLYAEDPANSFFPCTGTVVLWKPADHPAFARFDTGMESGATVSVYYDPMIAKVIVWGKTRAEAISRMIRVLKETVILGVTTNQSFLLSMLQGQAFQNGLVDTRYIEREFTTHDLQTMAALATSRAASELATVAMLYDFYVRNASRYTQSRLAGLPGGWTNGAGRSTRQSSNYIVQAQVKAARGGGELDKNPSYNVQYQHIIGTRHDSPLVTTQGGGIKELTPMASFKLSALPVVDNKKAGAPPVIGYTQVPIEELQEVLLLRVSPLLRPTDTQISQSHIGCPTPHDGAVMECQIGNVRRRFVVCELYADVANATKQEGSGSVCIHSDYYGTRVVQRVSRFHTTAADAVSVDGGFDVKAPMPCKVLRVAVKAKEKVVSGAVLVVVESMKMEMKIFADSDGIVDLVSCADGDVVAEGSQLLRLLTAK